MGVKSLIPFLKKYAPSAFREVHLSEYAFQKFSIDISIFMFKYKTISVLYEDWNIETSNRWIAGLINLIACLRKNNIHCCFVYDTSSPLEKQEERIAREKQREKYEFKLFELKNSYEKFILNGDIDDNLQQFCKESLLNKKLEIDEITIKKEIGKLKSRIVKITNEDYILSQRILDIMQVPYKMADSEGEATCSYMCVSNIVDGVISEDCDVLAYGSKLLLSKINTDSETVVEINLYNILESLDISQETFTDLCIMCGVDYNTNIPNYGPAKSYKLLKTYKSIDRIKDECGLDTSILKYMRCRELFSIPKNYACDIGYCGIPNYDELERIINEYNINGNKQGMFTVNIEYLKKCTKINLNFIDD